MVVKKVILLIGFCTGMHMALCQTPGTILVKAGEDATKVIPMKEQYRYPTFLPGRLIYPQNKKSELLRLNYNQLHGAMQFIDPKGDTLFIAEDSNIFKYVQVGNDLYYHDFREGYFEMLTKEGSVKLLSRYRWKIIRKEIVVDNGYGTSASVANTEYSARRSEEINNFVQNENTLFGKDWTFFLLGNKDKLYKATKSGFLKVFSDHKTEIQLYLKEQNTDFNNEADVRALLEFCLNLDNV
jgi:hypothetical protein